MLSVNGVHAKHRIYKTLALVYALNVLDLLLTLLLQSTGRFKEANPVMALFISDTFAALAAKIIVPALLCIYLAVRLHRATRDQLEKSQIAVGLLLIFYIGVNLLHIVWCSVHVLTL